VLKNLLERVPSLEDGYIVGDLSVASVLHGGRGECGGQADLPVVFEDLFLTTELGFSESRSPFLRMLTFPDWLVELLIWNQLVQHCEMQSFRTAQF